LLLQSLPPQTPPQVSLPLHQSLLSCLQNLGYYHVLDLYLSNLLLNCAFFLLV
jgi:hypothetical protein